MAEDYSNNGSELPTEIPVDMSQAYGGGGSDFFPPGKEDREQSSDIGVIRELDPIKVIETLRHYLRGEMWDSEKRVWMKHMEPLMNNKGIGKYLSIISAPVSSLITFSNFQLDEIPTLALYICDQAIPVIHVNYREYGITDKSNLQILDIQILFMTIAALKKALGAGDRNVIGRTISENIMNRSGSGAIQPLQSEKRGILSRLNPFAK